MAEFKDILKEIEKAVEKFNKNIPAAQRAMFEALEEDLKRLELNGKNIKATVRNLKIIQGIKNKLLKIILSEDYIKSVKEFARSFSEITTLQNEYWKGLESTFKPRPLLREIKKSAIVDTVKGLTEQGIGTTITEQISDILRTNITGGGSFKALTAQLRESLLTTKTDGLLLKYTRQITEDSLTQYNRNYNEVVSSDLGFEFYAWAGTEVKTSRPFCQSLVENYRYFHLCQIPNLLKGLDIDGNKLKYEDNFTKEIKTVEVNSKTSLPAGFIPGTNASNFMIRAGGYLCKHIPRAVPERNVKSQNPVVYNQIINSTLYKSWRKLHPKRSKFDI